MKPWRVREFHPDDLDQLVSVWQESRNDSVHAVYGLSDILTACSDEHAMVAVVGDRIIGAAAARVEADRAWVLMLAQAADWREQGVGSALLDGLEKRLTSRGVFRISALLPASETRIKAFCNSKYSVEEELHYFERNIPVQRQEIGPLSELGGRLLPRGLWDAMAGMHREKELIDRRLILPLARTDLSETLGVVPPRAVVLFGPPGTGKTTFAKAVASRLDWPFVEVFPSRLASDPRGLAAALRRTFQDISHLDHAVVFIDEVEEIASHRRGEPPSALQGVTNELLKIIPTFREQQGRILICATNFIRSLDKAFLRHGRFDYVIPIGLPDAAARSAIWARYVPGSVAGHVDVDILALQSERFSPADIEFAARKASQQALEHAVHESSGTGTEGGRTANDAVENVREPPLTTASYLNAIAQTRATVTEGMVEDFLEDIERIART
ncbi:GNAT family N-acetyltransferase [Micrococcaceae bacterium Sec5.7]